MGKYTRSSLITLFVVWSLLNISTAASAQEIYKSTDENGRVIFTDRRERPMQQAVILDEINTFESKQRKSVAETQQPAKTLDKHSTTYRFDATMDGHALDEMAIVLTWQDKNFEQAVLELNRSGRTDKLRCSFQKLGNTILLKKDGFFFPENIKLAITVNLDTGLAEGSITTSSEGVEHVAALYAVVTSQHEFVEQLTAESYGTYGSVGGVATTEAKQHASNLIINSNFDQGLEGWKVEDFVVWNFEDEKSQNGVAIFDKRIEGSSVEISRLSQCVPLNRNYDYQLDTGFRTDTGLPAQSADYASATWHYEIDCSDPGDVATMFSPKSLPGWQKLTSARLTTPPDVKALRIEIMKRHSSADTLAVWDNIEFRAVAPAKVASKP
jgi:hypothetical protein